jgi:hypothetical protein
MKHSFSPQVPRKSTGNKERWSAFGLGSHFVFRGTILGWRVVYCEFPLRSFRLEVLIKFVASEFPSTIASQVPDGTATMVEDSGLVFLVSFEGFAFLGNKVDIDLTGSVVLAYGRITFAVKALHLRRTPQIPVDSFAVLLGSGTRLFWIRLLSRFRLGTGFAKFLFRGRIEFDTGYHARSDHIPDRWV